MSTPKNQVCARCGAELIAFATEGSCPACLLEQGLFAEIAPSAAPRSRFGDYELIDEIARGGMGVVYKARQLRLDRIVAVKMILSGQFASASEMQRFRAEARATAALQHPGIVPIHEVGEHEGVLFFSMDFVEGSNLAQLIRDGPWSAARAAQCVRDVAAAIHYAHERGILHRDLKPSNVLINRDGSPRVTDFGLAKRLQNSEFETPYSELTLSGQVLGSPNFMPPEQAAGKHRQLTPASDVYSLGALLYHLLTGRPPFLAEGIPETLRLVTESEPVSPRLLAPNVPRDLETICLKCLEKDPQRRYSTAQELNDELGRFLGDDPIHARPPALAEKFGRWARRNPKIAGLTAALVLVAIVGFVSVSAQLQRANRHGAEAADARDRAERTAREEARARMQAEQLLRELQMQRVKDLLAADRAGAALVILADRLRAYPSDAGAAYQILWEMGRRNFALPLALPLTHSQYVMMARFSPDGNRVLTASFDGTARVWDAHTGEPLTPFMSHDAGVLCAAFSPDAMRIVTCAADGTVRVWDSHTGQPLLPILRHSGAVHWVAFSPDGLRLASAAENGEARIWDTQTGLLLHDLSGHQGNVVFVEFRPDGQHVVTASHDGTARIWQTKDGKPAVPALVHPDDVKGARFSPDGTLVVTWSDDSRVRVWSAVTGEMVLDPLVHDNDVCEATFSADNRRLVSGAWDRTAQVWDARTGKKLTPALQHPGGVTTARFNTSGDRIVTACWDGTARIWDAHTGQPLSEPFRQGQGLRWAEFSPDGERVVTASRDRSAQLWAVRPRQMSSGPFLHDEPVVTAVFSPNGRWLATASKDGLVRLWDFLASKSAGPVLRHESGMVGLCFSPDSGLLATLVQDGPARIWELPLGRLVVGPLQDETNAPTGTVPLPVIAFSPDGRKLATCAYDRKQGKALIWNLDSGRLLLPPMVHRGWIGAVDFSPDGRWFATASWDDTGRVWDLGTDELNQSFPVGRNIVSVNFSPNGLFLLTASVDQTARIWERNTKQIYGRPVVHANPVRAARFAPDGREFVTMSINAAQIWDSRTGQPRSNPLQHDGPVTAAKFHPGGSWLLTVAADRDLRLWNATNGEPLTVPLKWNGHVAAAEFSGSGVNIAVVSADHTVRVWEGPLWETDMPEWIGPLAEAVTGERAGAHGILEHVPASEFLKLRKRILTTPGSHISTLWAKRYLSDVPENQTR